MALYCNHTILVGSFVGVTMRKPKDRTPWITFKGNGDHVILICTNAHEADT